MWKLGIVCSLNCITLLKAKQECHKNVDQKNIYSSQAELYKNEKDNSICENKLEKRRNSEEKSKCNLIFRPWRIQIVCVVKVFTLYKQINYLVQIYTLFLLSISKHTIV